MAIRRIPKVSVSQAVFEQLRDQIFSGNWPPGSRLPSENELARMLGVSRISVRAALQKLNTLGLVQSRQGGGTFVTDVTVDVYLNPLIPALALGKHDLLEILEFRRVYEVENARLAAMRRTEKDLERLEAIMERMRQVKEDLSLFSVEDLNFHLEVARAAKNSLILKVAQITKDILRHHMKEIVAFRGSKDGLYYHPLILEAIAARDPQRAAEIMAEHIETMIDDVREHYPEEEDNRGGAEGRETWRGDRQADTEV
ncbi:FadR/GntR family transcriptional regulator [Thermanaeromonas sp. C210]|uniref:FadR/GntR family transcriptional regulator n=1 Tax=Thermanaeromonas sp. C210 TaxID=2731925 RepID=UPI00155B8F18|nr:FadR/GntR family transcriptional regulator [Thermanaeromonas sp. C210]GFN22665.1 GntR family transcriptional regulator [Thermanaeromonas sp. C210]